MYGRISKLWEPLAGKWTSRVIRLCWQFGLELWTVRNKLAHGNIGGVSTQERHQVRCLIEILYNELLHTLPQNVRILFARSRTEMLLLPYQSQLAWLGKMKFLCPIQYRELEVKLARMVRSPQEIEHQHTIRLEVNTL